LVYKSDEKPGTPLASLCRRPPVRRAGPEVSEMLENAQKAPSDGMQFTRARVFTPAAATSWPRRVTDLTCTGTSELRNWDTRHVDPGRESLERA
jgi:hypothetical protein